jgi:hypothetical protein
MAVKLGHLLVAELGSISAVEKGQLLRLGATEGRKRRIWKAEPIMTLLNILVLAAGPFTHYTVWNVIRDHLYCPNHQQLVQRPTSTRLLCEQRLLRHYS